jgi:hypothetical protein
METAILGSDSRKCDLSLYDHRERGDSYCVDDPGHRQALQARRDALAGAWSLIERGSDRGGDRDFLDGKPIHCGSALDLQAMEFRSDDYGEYTAWIAKGTIVRYEVEWVAPPAKKRIVLYTTVAGHTFTAHHEEWMRFRWPRPSRSR